MDKCIAIIKTGPRKGEKCGASKKVIDNIDGKDIPHCNRHRNKIKENKDVNILSEKLNNNLKIEETEKIDENNEIIRDGDREDDNISEKDNEYVELDGQDILDKLDKQLDELFNDYGL